jgi:predicted dehydrogenase
MLRGAIIGTGKIAQTGHLPAYKNEFIKNEIEIVAAVDISERNRLTIKNNYPAIHVYEYLEELFKNEKLDFIDICIPPNNHKSLIETAVKHELHILCEKPFTVGLDEAGELEYLLSNKNIVFMPCHQYKYSPIWQTFKDVIDNGNPSSKNILQFNIFRKQADPGFDSLSPDWRINDKISGGGILADTGVHYLYLVSWMLGRVLNITANTYSLKHNYTVEDTGLIVIESEKGIAQITLTWAADRRANSARAIYNSRSIYYDGDSMYIYKDNHEKKISVPNASDKSTYILQYIHLIKEFIRKIKSEESSKEYALEAFQSILMLNSCYQSANNKKTIHLTPDLWINESKPYSLF